MTCDEYSQWLAFNPKSIFSEHDRIFRTNSDGSEFFRIIALTDCANAYSSVLSIQPKSFCRLSKINLCYIRDIISNGILSFIDAPANLSDVLTKLHGNVKIFNSFCTHNIFRISFLGRAGLKILQRLKECAYDENKIHRSV